MRQTYSWIFISHEPFLNCKSWQSCSYFIHKSPARATSITGIKPTSAAEKAQSVWQCLYVSGQRAPRTKQTLRWHLQVRLTVPCPPIRPGFPRDLYSLCLSSPPGYAAKWDFLSRRRAARISHITARLPLLRALLNSGASVCHFCWAFPVGLAVVPNSVHL